VRVKGPLELVLAAAAATRTARAAGGSVAGVVLRRLSSKRSSWRQ
jgi:hypothetical protein